MLAVLVVDVIGDGSVPRQESTFTTSVMTAEPPEARPAAVQLTAPVPPTAGAVQAHPAGALTDTNVVFGGVDSARATLTAALGPLFVTVIA